MKKEISAEKRTDKRYPAYVLCCDMCGKTLSNHPEHLANSATKSKEYYDILVYNSDCVDFSTEYSVCSDCYENNPSLSKFHKCEVYSRVVGYIRPVDQWHVGKRQEYKDRKEFKETRLN